MRRRTSTITPKKQNIRNPQKWVGRYVRHLANYWDFAWGDNGFFVCEHTGKLFPVAEEGVPSMDTELLEKHSPFDPCYYYSDEAIVKFERMVEAKLGI